MMSTNHRRVCENCHRPLGQKRRHCSMVCKVAGHRPKQGQVFGNWAVVDGIVLHNRKTGEDGYRAECRRCGWVGIIKLQRLRDAKASNCKGCRQCKNWERRVGTAALDGKKRCCSCAVTKNVGEFNANHKTEDGLSVRCRRCGRDSDLRRKFGISLEDYESMLDEQHSRCLICGRHFSEVGGKGDGLVVDHCHKTGKIRGLLCSNCNTALGLLQEDPSSLRRAVAYLTDGTVADRKVTQKA